MRRDDLGRESGRSSRHGLEMIWTVISFILFRNDQEASIKNYTANFQRVLMQCRTYTGHLHQASTDSFLHSAEAKYLRHDVMSGLGFAQRAR